ncbi:ras-related GTP-binding protein B isoform X4 [Orcinus orca]|nr:ras-related GTP-binding protein B isoform X4 [Orcinus orca]
MEESDSEKKMEKENLGTRMDPPIGEPEGSLGWVLPNTAMKKKVRHVRYIKNMKVKVLLMGKSGSGKTSMRSIIFANYIARDTRRLGATILDRLHSLQINSSLSTYSLVDSVGNTKTFDVEHSHVRFLGNLVLNLWDCGGQDTFMENYFTSQRDNIFRNVEVLIYVFDVESRELEKDMHYYQSCLEAILQNSPDAKIFCLVHKMDLVQEDQRDLIFKEREEDLRRLSRPLECSCFRTSIWDETLYKAWSSIVYQLIPNVQQLEMNLRNFAEIIEADEVLLFERATFLLLTWKRCNGQLSDVAKSSDGEVKGQRAHRQGSLAWKFTTLSPVFPASGNSNKQVISHYQCKEQRDVHRFEKISNIIKQFKLSCSKLAASFQSMEVRNSNFAAFIDIFTSNTYVMVVMSDPSIPSAATLINIRNARKHFEKLERVDGPKQCLLMR